MVISAPRRQKERETDDEGCPEREDVMASEAEGGLGPKCAPVLRVWTLLVKRCGDTEGFSEGM